MDIPVVPAAEALSTLLTLRDFILRAYFSIDELAFLCVLAFEV
jgi:hypothetical protein